MDRLRILQSEYDKNADFLAHPIDVVDLEQLKQRRIAILQEARKLAKTLNISQPQGFSYIS